jgi:hypothetical protein
MTDAKEVGVGNPAEETFHHPDAQFIAKKSATVKPCRWKIFSAGCMTEFFGKRPAAAFMRQRRDLSCIPFQPGASRFSLRRSESAPL